jgi:D-threo-aldose 1-dehydrogenase
MGSLGRKDSLAMLEAAYDAGLRHFDVAPLYGYGQAEDCLGEFLARHRGGDVTVTTKFGIPAEEAKSLKGMVRGLARPVLKLLPGLKKRLQGVAASGAAAGPAPKLDFSTAKARASLERSLTALRVERIDVWLLHEAEAEDLGDESLLRLMEDAVAAGKIGTFGVGSGREKMAVLLAERAAFCPVVQYEWSVLDPVVEPGTAFRIHHRALTENFRALHEALAADTARCRRWSEFCGIDVGDAEVLARLMLKASLVCNPESVVLFSSKRPGHMRSNVAAVEDAGLEAAALRLYSLVRAEMAQVFPAGVTV